MFWADSPSARAQIFRRLAEPRSKAKGTRHEDQATDRGAVAGGSLCPRSFGPGSFGPNDAAGSSGKAGGVVWAKAAGTKATRAKAAASDSTAISGLILMSGSFRL